MRSLTAFEGIQLKMKLQLKMVLLEGEEQSELLEKAYFVGEIGFGVLLQPNPQIHLIEL